MGAGGLEQVITSGCREMLAVGTRASWTILTSYFFQCLLYVYIYFLGARALFTLPFIYQCLPLLFVSSLYTYIFIKLFPPVSSHKNNPSKLIHTHTHTICIVVASHHTKGTKLGRHGPLYLGDSVISMVDYMMWLCWIQTCFRVPFATNLFCIFYFGLFHSHVPYLTAEPWEIIFNMARFSLRSCCKFILQKFCINK